MSEILEKNNYLVRVKKKNSGPSFEFTVSYPSQELFMRGDKASEDKYEIKNNRFIYNSDEKLELPNYLQRLVVLVDIYQKCKKKNIKTELVTYTNEKDEQVKSFWKLTEDMNLEGEDREKENILKDAIKEVINKGIISKAVSDKIEEKHLHQSMNLLTGYLV